MTRMMAATCGSHSVPGDRRLGFEHGDGAGFVAVTPVLVDVPFARQRLGGRADGLDLAIEGRLIVLDLDNQMGIGDRGGLDSNTCGNR